MIASKTARHVVGILFLWIFVVVFVETPVHEFGHYWTATLLRHEAIINGASTTVFGTLSPFLRSVVFLSGGLFAGSVFLVLFVFVKHPYRNALVPVVASEFFYAPLDATLLGWIVASVVGFVVLQIVVVDTVLEDEREREETEEAADG